VSYIEYSSNNSGGGWWLSDQNWKDLETAGWKVQWAKDMEDGIFHTKGEDRWLGALAYKATREGLSYRMAVAEWEDVTGMSAYDEGCGCCGQPHSFSEYDDEGEWIG
jgi:hypothetical protein